MNIIQKVDEMLEEYKELCDYFNVKQKPLNDFSNHYQELRERLHDEAMNEKNNEEP